MDAAAEDHPLDATRMLELIQRQQAHVQRRAARLVPWILLSWTIAWPLGHLILWASGGSAVAAFLALTGSAVAVSAVLGARSGHGVQTTPGAAFTGTVFGVSCTVAFLGTAVLGIQLLVQGMPSDLAQVYFPVIWTLVLSVVHLMAGAIWRAVPSVVLGGLLAAVALTAGFFPVPTTYLVVGVGGGLVFLGGWITTLRWISGRSGSSR